MKARFIPLSFVMALMASFTASYLGCGENKSSTSDANNLLPDPNRPLDSNSIPNPNRPLDTNTTLNPNNAIDTNQRQNPNNECTKITYTNTIKSIINTHCISCHGPGTSYNLSDYDSVKKQAQMIKTVVESNRMPPPSKARVPDDKKQNLYKWIECNTPE
jgi:mono/diheme cytochrome c family protein